MRVLGAVVSLLVVLAACVGDGEAGSTSTTVPSGTTTTMVESTTTEPVTTTTATPTATSVPGQTVLVVFASADQSDCANVASAERVVGAGVDPILAAFELLAGGPTPAEEASGLGSMFSDATAGMVRSAELSGGLLTVDFDDFSAVIPNASTSCGSMSLIAQLNGTAFQFDGVESVTYSFEGSCQAFFNWLQRDCQTYESPTAADLVWERAEVAVEGLVKSVAAGGPGFVAVGSISNGYVNPAAWVSGDGLTWNEASVEGSFDASHETINSVVAGGPGFVAVGMDTFTTWGRRWDAAVWVSEDGLVWERVSHPALAEDEVQEMWGVTRSGSDLLAVGFGVRVEYEPDAAVWRSPDGYQWERVGRDLLASDALDFIPDDHEPTIALGPNGYVAIGADELGEAPALWRSPDGQTWEKLPNKSLPSLESGLLVAIAATDDRYAVIGTHASPEGSDVMIWQSGDGLEWTQSVFEMDGSQGGAAIATYGDEILLVGQDWDTSTDLIWHSPSWDEWEPLTSPAFENSTGLPLVAYVHQGEVMILGADRPPLVGRP